MGFGRWVETWLVWSVRYWCPAVLKVGRPGHSGSERVRRSLRREVAALDTRHPGLPRLVADGTESAEPYVLTEYVDGPDLAEAVDETGVLDPVDVALLGAQLLPALMDLHRRGLAHLDVKPENVVLGDGRPVLVDCGSARAIGSLQPPGRPVGTEGYAAPELEACEPVSAAMDLYGLGTVLAEALTGVPFPDGGPLPRTTVTGLVERSLSSAPDDRGRAGDVLDELARCCGNRWPWPEWLDRYATRSRCRLMVAGAEWAGRRTDAQGGLASYGGDGWAERRTGPSGLSDVRAEWGGRRTEVRAGR